MDLLLNLVRLPEKPAGAFPIPPHPPQSFPQTSPQDPLPAAFPDLPREPSQNVTGTLPGTPPKTCPKALDWLRVHSHLLLWKSLGTITTSDLSLAPPCRS